MHRNDFLSGQGKQKSKSLSATHQPDITVTVLIVVAVVAVVEADTPGAATIAGNRRRPNTSAMAYSEILEY